MKKNDSPHAHGRACPAEGTVDAALATEYYHRLTIIMLVGSQIIGRPYCFFCGFSVDWISNSSGYWLLKDSCGICSHVLRSIMYPRRSFGPGEINLQVGGWFVVYMMGLPFGDIVATAHRRN